MTFDKLFGSVSSSVSGTCLLRLTMIAFGEKERHSRHITPVSLLIYHIRKLRDIISLQKVVGEVFIPRYHFTRCASTKDRNCSVVRWSQPMRSIKAYSLLLLDRTNFSVTPFRHIRRQSPFPQMLIEALLHRVYPALLHAALLCK